MDVGGFRYTRRVNVSARFLPETFEGFHLKIVGSANNDIDTDIAVTDTGGSYLTGTEMAAELQAQIRAAIGAGADLTVAWTNFYFTVDAIDSTSIAISAPSAEVTYQNATAKYFGGVDAETDTITGGFPEGCTVGSQLNSNYRKIINVVWDRVPLREAADYHFVNPQTTGTPAYYRIENWNYLLLFPIPTSQKDLVISYQGFPSIDASPTTSSVVPTDIPTEFHKAIANKVAEEMLLGTFEDRYADRRRAEYEQYVRKYKVMRSNQNTDGAGGNRVEQLPYYVVED
jgi:hypothetical protein